MKKLLVSTLLLAGLAGVLPGQTYNITTVAGSPTNALGDGGAAGLASLVLPRSAVVDAAGNVYIADSYTFPSLPASGTVGTANSGGRIRKIDGKTGIITTLMFSSTNFEPWGIALDPAGTFLYVADNNRHIIRAVDTTTGANTTFMGNSGNGGFTGDGRQVGTTSRLRNPRGVWVDAAGNIYIADTGNSRIRRVDATSRIVTSVAGRGPTNSTSVANPSGTAGLTVNNVAGDGGKATIALLGNPEGVVGDNNGNLYIADTAFNRIRKVDKNGIITTVAGLGTAGAADGVDAAQAQFSGPRGLAIGPDKNLYIADTGNNRVRQLNFSTNIVRTVAGGGASSLDNIQAASSTLNGPTSVAFDGAGNMVIADQQNSRVRSVDAGTGLITTTAGTTTGRGDNGPATQASLGNPRGVAVDSAGAVYISDTNNNKVRKVDPTSGIITRFAGFANGTGGNGLSAAAGGANGPGLATQAGLSLPGCVATDTGNNVYVADRGNGKIRKVDTTGNLTTVVNSGNVANNPSGFYNGDGNTALGANVLSAGSATTSGGPNCVTVDNLGTLYITDTGNNVIRKVSNGTISTVVGFVTTTVGANGIPVNSGVAGYAGDGGSPTEALLSAPQGVGVDSTGNLLCIADTGNHIVRLVDFSKSSIVTIAGLAGDGSSDGNLPIAGWQSRLNTPSGCAFDTAGNVFIADTVNSRILKVDGKSGVMSMVAGGGTDTNPNGKAATTAKLNQPLAVATDATGDVFFTDRIGLVYKLTPAAATSTTP